MDLAAWLVPGLIVAGPAVGALGAAMAQVSAPLACNWPNPNTATLVERMRHLARNAPGRAQRRVGGVVLSLLLSGAAALSYAASPAAPPRPPEAAPRSVASDVPMQMTLYHSVGEALAGQYQPPQRRQVAPGAVTPLGLAELLPEPYAAAAQEELASGRWDGRPQWGLSLAETARLIGYGAHRDRVFADWHAAGWQPGASATGRRPSEAEAVGAGYIDFLTLDARRVEYELAFQTAELRAKPIHGPAAFTVPAGETPAQAATRLGVDPRGLWSLSLADAKGARRMTRTAEAPYMIYVPLEAQARAARTRAGMG